MPTVPGLAANTVKPNQSKRSPVWVRDIGFTTLFDPPGDPVANVVIVHGFLAKKTFGIFKKKASRWEEKRVKTSIFCPADLLPDDRNDVRLMTYGYDSHVTKGFEGPASHASISEHGRSFLNSLTSERRDYDGRPLIFVAHSLSRLIVKEALRRSREERHHGHLKDVYRSTFAIILFGTPYPQFDTTKTILSDLDPSSGSAKLDELSEAFSDMLDEQGFRVYSFQESQGKAGVKPLRQQVVPNESSALNERRHEIKEFINVNHMEMCKFKGQDDDGYTKFLAVLHLYIREIQEKKSQTIKATANSLEMPLLELTDMGEPSSAQMYIKSQRESQQEQKGSQQGARFIIPYLSNPDFVGRSEILDEIKHYFRLGHQQEGATPQARAAIFGLGGIAKTQIALAYAYWVQERSPDVSVFWVHASTPERFHQAFSQIAQNGQIPAHDEPKADTSMLVKDWLERIDQRPWRMIIDNADDTEIFFGSKEAQPQPQEGTSPVTSQGNLRRYIPECSHESILVTTRNKQTGVKFVRGRGLIEVKGMSETESNQLFTKKLQDDSLAPEQMALLTARLENLPLALTQAAAFIQENSLTIGRYLQLLDESDDTLVELLSQPFEEVGRDSSIPNAVTATWMISFKQIRKQYPLAIDLLSLMGFFDRHGIPKLFLSHHCEQDYGQHGQQKQGIGPRGMIGLEKALGILNAFSFVSEGETDRIINMHRLIQLVTRKWLVTEGVSSEWASRALSIVSDLFPKGSYEIREKRQDSQEYLPHVYAVLSHGNSCSATEAVAQASLRHRASRFMIHQAEWNNAEVLLQQAIETSKRVLGGKHPDTLISMGNLATTYDNQGRFEEAEQLYVQVIDTMQRVFGKEHPETLIIIDNLTCTYYRQGRWKEAEELEIQLIETKKRVLGEEHPDTLRGISNLAGAYTSQERWKEAEELIVQVLKMSLKVLGEEHPQTLTSMSILAWIYRNQGRLKVAEELNVQVLETRKSMLGEEHLDTLRSRANLALTWKLQGRDEALELLTLCCERLVEKLGAQHPDTLPWIDILKSWTQEKQSISRHRWA